MSLFSSNEEHFCTPFSLHNERTNDSTRRNKTEPTRLEPENEYGNVEYKLRLTNPTQERVEKLVTQLKWRIREGNGQAIVFLGVRDDGQLVGLTQQESLLSLQTLERMSDKIGAKMSIVSERFVDQKFIEDDDLTKTRINKVKGRTKSSDQSNENFNYRSSNSENGRCAKITKRGSRETQVRKIFQVLVKRKTHDIWEELRVAVLGPTESGKSSLLGVLSHSQLDNGRGSARLNLFRHRHEVRSGQTSCISHEVFGFNVHGQPLTYDTCLNTEEIIENSAKIITLIDLAGHQRYLSTTLYGLGSHAPDIVLLVVSATAPITNVILDDVSLTIGLQKSLAIVINKIDLLSSTGLEEFFADLVEKINALNLNVMPSKITEDSIIRRRFSESTILPIFFTSCVSGSGLAMIYSFFREASPSLKSDNLHNEVSKSAEVLIDETFEIPGIGTVVSGLITEGTIREGDEMLLGPNEKADFCSTKVMSLQRHKVPCNFARAGNKCTMAISGNTFKVRRGMVLRGVDLLESTNQSVCLEFEANVRFLITNKQPRITNGSQIPVYIGNVKQTCHVDSVKQATSSNKNRKLILRFTKRPEYIKLGSKLMLRHGFFKGLGEVTSITPFKANAVDHV